MHCQQERRYAFSRAPNVSKHIAFALLGVNVALAFVAYIMASVIQGDEEKRSKLYGNLPPFVINELDRITTFFIVSSLLPFTVMFLRYILITFIWNPTIQRRNVERDHRLRDGLMGVFHRMESSSVRTDFQRPLVGCSPVDGRDEVLSSGTVPPSMEDELNQYQTKVSWARRGAQA